MLKLHVFLSMQNSVQFTNSFTLDDPKPCKVYEFQVRCGCNTGLMSDWTATHSVNLTSGESLLSEVVSRFSLNSNKNLNKS